MNEEDANSPTRPTNRRSKRKAQEEGLLTCPDRININQSGSRDRGSHRKQQTLRVSGTSRQLDF
eukprot:jgi/Picsp_1/6174/NSC_03528-R1_---NA---